VDDLDWKADRVGELSRWPLGTNLVEVINNTIKVTKRMATASVTTPALSSRSGPRLPELGDEPKKAPQGA